MHCNNNTHVSFTLWSSSFHFANQNMLNLSLMMLNFKHNLSFQLIFSQSFSQHRWRSRWPENVAAIQWRDHLFDIPKVDITTHNDARAICGNESAGHAPFCIVSACQKQQESVHLFPNQLVSENIGWRTDITNDIETSVLESKQHEWFEMNESKHSSTRSEGVNCILFVDSCWASSVSQIKQQWDASILMPLVDTEENRIESTS